MFVVVLLVVGAVRLSHAPWARWRHTRHPGKRCAVRGGADALAPPGGADSSCGAA